MYNIYCGLLREKLRGGLHMRYWSSLAHAKWKCKYHVVLIPKYKHKVLLVRVGDKLEKY